MHYQALLTARDARPFEPFDIVMSSGMQYPIRHPENLGLYRSYAVIPLYHASPPSEAADDIVRANYSHIASLETLRRSRQKPKAGARSSFAPQRIAGGD
jgi:hypothetical protein